MVQAIGVTEPGGPDALRVLDVAAEPLGSGQVRIAVRAAAVNPVDTLVRARPATDGEPVVRVPGMDVAGVLTEIGEGVAGSFSVGDAVMAIVQHSGEHGGYRADLVVPAGSIAPVPANLSEVQAATIPMNGLTAQLALDTLALSAGATVAVTGAAGTLGGYSVELAKEAGLTVVADYSEKDEEFLRACGADELVRRGDGFADEVRRRFPDGVDGLIDAAVLDAAVLGAVKDGGTVVTVRGYEGDGTDRVLVVPIKVSDYIEVPEKLARLAELAEDGQLTVRVAGEFPVVEAAEAHKSLEDGGTRGRFVLRFA